MGVLHEVVNQQPFYQWLETNNERVEELLGTDFSTIICYEESRYDDDFVAVQELLFWQMGSRQTFDILPWIAQENCMEQSICQLKKEFRLWNAEK
ncbi:hypothetical protein [Clostridium sp.]|uniref:hypothetical protein n=1 Tax=Clostridium sp. TaxID=1506 RepID=UPI001A373E9B|nr:hypothetical protein [Clostridium sp.]MBK5237160.1 hypothetical protein [Clostridium sp.]